MPLSSDPITTEMHDTVRWCDDVIAPHQRAIQALLRATMHATDADRARYRTALVDHGATLMDAVALRYGAVQALALLDSPVRTCPPAFEVQS